ncbi:MAG TPA: gliding motility-associated C-terminal domain-containing protein [Bacteroidia bacterium]|jgi:gliding motility-associated-like protein|nr:gliding motility-associated C-terminal domain-containing protein [Bacteroidia bacterium]
MREDLHKIDDLFRDTIENYEFSPSDKVWNSIDGKLQQKIALAKEKTIRNLRFSVVALVATICVFVAYHYYTPQTAGNSIVKSQPGIKTGNSITSNNNGLAEETIPQSANNTQVSSIKNENKENSSYVSNRKESDVNKNAEVQQPEKIIVAEKNTTENDSKNQNQSVQKYTSIVNDANHTKDNGISKNNTIPSNNNLVSDNSAKKDNNIAQNNTTEVNPKKPDVPGTNAEIQENIIYVPSAFTPNGDGLNDFFVPKSAEELKEYKLYIYDYRGIQVFFSDDINKGWDGKSTNNGLETIKEDVYIWRIELRTSKNEAHQFKGTLTLVK